MILYECKLTESPSDLIQLVSDAWLIDCCLKFSIKYFLHCQDKNELNNIIKQYRYESGFGQLGQQLWTGTVYK